MATIDEGSGSLVAKQTMKGLWRHPAAILCWTLFVGCAPTLYTVHILPAARVVQQAEEAGAAELAPYEYHFANEHLRQARQEAGDAFYQDALGHAKIAEEYGEKALDLSRRRRREEGR